MLGKSTEPSTGAEHGGRARRGFDSWHQAVQLLTSLAACVTFTPKLFFSSKMERFLWKMLVKRRFDTGMRCCSDVFTMSVQWVTFWRWGNVVQLWFMLLPAHQRQLVHFPDVYYSSTGATSPQLFPLRPGFSWPWLAGAPEGSQLCSRLLRWVFHTTMSWTSFSRHCCPRANKLQFSVAIINVPFRDDMNFLLQETWSLDQQGHLVAWRSSYNSFYSPSLFSFAPFFLLSNLQWASDRPLPPLVGHSASEQVCPSFTKGRNGQQRFWNQIIITFDLKVSHTAR